MSVCCTGRPVCFECTGPSPVGSHSSEHRETPIDIGPHTQCAMLQPVLLNHHMILLDIESSRSLDMMIVQRFTASFHYHMWLMRGWVNMATFCCSGGGEPYLKRYPFWAVFGGFQSHLVANISSKNATVNTYSIYLFAGINLSLSFFVIYLRGHGILIIIALEGSK